MDNPTLPSTKIKEAAYKHSGDGRCWWIEKYIKNSFSGIKISKMKRRR